MAKAVSTAAQLSPGEDEVARAGDAMLMLISRAMWETLLIQGRAEGLGPAQVLDRALRRYLEEHGSSEAVAYLHRVAGGRHG